MRREKTVAEILGIRPLPSELEVGIEIEMEGENLRAVNDEFWRTENDGSLRGESYEYVLHTPINRSSVGKALSSLQNSLRNSDLRPSNRCGVHVHINVQSLTSSQLISFIVLYLCLENVLTKWCGEDRVGNLFCLRVKDAEYILDSIMEFMRDGDIRIFGTDVRYGAMNLSSLNKYGSLEFRAMSTPADFGLVDTWVDMLLRVFEKSREFKSAWDIPTALSVAGSEMFLEQTMGEHAQILADPDLDQMVMDGVRLAQAVAYAPFSPKCQENRKQRRAAARGEVPEEQAGNRNRQNQLAPDEAEFPAPRYVKKIRLGQKPRKVRGEARRARFGDGPGLVHEVEAPRLNEERDFTLERFNGRLDEQLQIRRG